MGSGHSSSESQQVQNRGPFELPLCFLKHDPLVPGMRCPMPPSQATESKLGTSQPTRILLLLSLPLRCTGDFSNCIEVERTLALGCSVECRLPAIGRLLEKPGFVLPPTPFPLEVGRVPAFPVPEMRRGWFGRG